MRCYTDAFTMPTIAILGTMDTKGEEHGFVADRIKQRGHQVLVIDVGALGAPGLNPDITRREVAAAADVDFDALAAKIGRAHVELQSRLHLVCRLLLEKKKKYSKSSRWGSNRGFECRPKKC